MADQDNVKEEMAYLEDVLNEYARFVSHIGDNGLSANLVLYYRDEVNDALRDLEGRAPLESYWQKTVEADEQLREKKAALVAEIGRENYRIQRQARNPAKTEWWWYLDLGIPEPEKPGVLQSWWNWISKP